MIVQLVMSDSYLPGMSLKVEEDIQTLTTLSGAAVLAHSLRDNGTKYKLACLVTLDSVRPTTVTELKVLQHKDCLDLTSQLLTIYTVSLRLCHSGRSHRQPQPVQPLPHEPR